MILLDILDKYQKYFYIDKPKSTYKFYLLANNIDILDYSFLQETDFYTNPNSICVLFNSAHPLISDQNIRHHNRKWIFFRSLSRIIDGVHYRDLSILKDNIFDRFYFVPEILDSSKYKNIDYFWNTISYLKNHNINLSQLHHMDIFESSEFTKIKLYHKRIKKTMSTGFWIYLYLKSMFPLSDIYLVGYDLKINSSFHDSSFEHGYLLSEIINNKCFSIKSLD